MIILRSGVGEATCDACDHSALSAAGGFEDEQSTTGGLYPTRRWLCPCRRGTLGVAMELGECRGTS